MNLNLENKSALVTGGAAGIGAAVVRLLAVEGAFVTIADRDQTRGETLAKELVTSGAKAIFSVVDLTKEADCRRALEETLAAFGRLDLLVNNAGVNDSVSLDRSPGDFMASLQRNLFPVFAVTHHAREALRAARGAIVNIGSKVAVTGQGATSGYAAAKGGIHALTREWAVALAPDGVRVNCVAPAECDTLQYQRWFQAQPDPAAARADIEKLVPLGHRLTTPNELAAMVVFLLSPHSAHTTGQIIFVDGGYTHLDRTASHGHQKWTGPESGVCAPGP